MFYSKFRHSNGRGRRQGAVLCARMAALLALPRCHWSSLGSPLHVNLWWNVMSSCQTPCRHCIILNSTVEIVEFGGAWCGIWTSRILCGIIHGRRPDHSTVFTSEWLSESSCGPRGRAGRAVLWARSRAYLRLSLSSNNVSPLYDTCEHLARI